MIKNIIKQAKQKIQKLDIEYYYIIFIAMFILMPLISKNTVIGHDSLYHITNIDALTKELENFQISKISSIIANGLGYGGAIFYPKLPHYIASLINLVVSNLGYNSFYSLNISYCIIVILSGIFMYWLLKLIFENKKVAFLGSGIYMSMPYFTNEIYVRGAFNESFLYIFMPLVFIGLIYLLKGNIKKFYIYFIIGYLGMVNSHLVLSVYFTMFVLIYIVFNIKRYFTRKNIKHLILAAIVLLILMSPNIALLIEHKISEKYVVFDPIIMRSNVENIQLYALSIKDFFIPKISEMDNTYVFINFIVWILAVLGIYNIIKEKNRDRKNILLGILGFLVMSALFSLNTFPYQYIPQLLLSIQFAFRNVTFVCFSLSIIAASGILLFKDSLRKNLIYIIIVISCCIVAVYINETKLVKINEIGNLESFNGMGAQKEYLTMKAYKNSNYLKTRDKNIKVLSKNKLVRVKIIEDSAPKLVFNISKIKEKDKVSLELPRLYYLGYKITLTTKDGREINLKYVNDKYGFIKITVPENGCIKVKYVGTVLYQFFIWTRAIVVIIIITIFIIKKKNQKIY